MSRNPLQNRLITIVEPVIQHAGFELVDLRFLLEQGGWVLRVQIDTPLASPANAGRAASPEAVRSEIASPANAGRAASPEAVRSEIASPANAGRAASPEAVRSEIAQVTDVSQVPSERVSLLDCEDMSRELSAVLDVDDPITQAYSLEVSSPGIDRPLRTAAHFAHFVGSEAKIQLAIPMQLPTGERKNFKGVLRGVRDDKVAIDVDGQTFELAIADIDNAKLVPDWDAVMHGKSGAGAPAQKSMKPGHRPTQKAKH